MFSVAIRRPELLIWARRCFSLTGELKHFIRNVIKSLNLPIPNVVNLQLGFHSVREPGISNITKCKKKKSQETSWVSVHVYQVEMQRCCLRRGWPCCLALREHSFRSFARARWAGHESSPGRACYQRSKCPWCPTFQVLKYRNVKAEFPSKCRGGCPSSPLPAYSSLFCINGISFQRMLFYFRKEYMTIR